MGCGEMLEEKTHLRDCIPWSKKSDLFDGGVVGWGERGERDERDEREVRRERQPFCCFESGGAYRGVTI